jgi:hypothetical protein
MRLLLVSRIIYSLLNRANHVKVEAHLAPPPLTSLSIPHTQSIYWKIIESDFCKLEVCIRACKRKKLHLSISPVQTWQQCPGGKPQLPLVQNIRVKHAEK